MEWLKKAIENYDNLTEGEQAHVDAALDSMDEPEGCICGEKDCGEEYEHMTGGY